MRLIVWIVPAVLFICDGYFLKPELQICDSGRLLQFSKNFCRQKLVFTTSTTKVDSDCMCISGIWLVLSRDCNPSVIVSNRGCVLTPQIKSVQYLGTFGRDDFFIVISKSDKDMTYSVLRPFHSAKVFGHVWIFNGVMSKSGDGYHCVGKRVKASSKLVSRYFIRGELSIQEECSPTFKFPVAPNLEYAVLSQTKLECKIDCNRSSTSKLVRRPLGFTSFRNKILFNKSGKLSETAGAASRGKGKLLEAPKKIMTLKDHLHKRLLQRILHQAFPDKRVEPHASNIPSASFQILEMLTTITLKTCANSVSARFLELAFMLFRTIYERKGSFLLEVLREEETSRIMHFLGDCHSNLKPLEFERGEPPCYTNQKTYVRKNGSFVFVDASSYRHPDVYLTRRHLVTEAIWNLVDLTVGICIDAFAQSYILYHKMEQALEKLYQEDVRILWRFPPNSEVVYRRLFGPFWSYHAENLEKCVEAVYTRNSKLSRLRRPDETLPNNRLTGINSRSPLRRRKTRLDIPTLTRSMQRVASTGTNVTVMTNKVILASVGLTCQSFHLTDCQDGTGSSSILW